MSIKLSFTILETVRTDWNVIPFLKARQNRFKSRTLWEHFLSRILIGKEPKMPFLKEKIPLSRLYERDYQPKGRLFYLIRADDTLILPFYAPKDALPYDDNGEPVSEWLQELPDATLTTLLYYENVDIYVYFRYHNGAVRKVFMDESGTVEEGTPLPDEQAYLTEAGMNYPAFILDQMNRYYLQDEPERSVVEVYGY